MVPHGEFHRIAALRLVVGGIAVEGGTLSVILLDERLEVPVLHHHPREAPGAVPDQVEELPDVTGPASEGGGVAVVAVADQLVIIGGPDHIAERSLFQKQGAKLLVLEGVQVDLRKLQVLLQVLVGKLLLLEEFQQDAKAVPRVQGKEAKLPDEGEGAFLDAEEEVCQVAVEVVVDLNAALFQRPGQEDGSAAAEHIHEAFYFGREEFVDEPEQLSLSADPGERRFHTPPPPPFSSGWGGISSNLSSAATSPSTAAWRPLIMTRRARIVRIMSPAVLA